MLLAFTLRRDFMRKFLITAAAGAAMLAAGSLSASAMTPGIPSTDGINPVSKVALCFYIDGWNGPGLYDCGFRYRRGYGWHGHRHGGHGAHHRGHRGGHHGHKSGHRGGHKGGHKGKHH
jgi:hypothetical protein